MADDTKPPAPSADDTKPAAKAPAKAAPKAEPKLALRGLHAVRVHLDVSEQAQHFAFAWNTGLLPHYMVKKLDALTQLEADTLIDKLEENACDSPEAVRAFLVLEYPEPARPVVIYQ